MDLRWLPWLGRRRDDIRPGPWSPVLPALTPFYLFQLNSGVSFRHCLYAIAWLRHHKYFNALATGHEILPPTSVSPGTTLRAIVRLCKHCRHPFPAVVHTSSQWFCNGDSGYIRPGMASSQSVEQERVGGVALMSPLITNTTTRPSWHEFFLPHLHPIDSSVAPQEGAGFPHLRG